MISRAPRVHSVAPPGSHAAPAERTLWTGRPTLSGTFWHIFRGRWVVLYLLVLLLFRVADALATGGGAASLVGAVTSVGVLALVLLALLLVFARLTAAASSYTITDRRIVIQLGVALPMTIDLPLTLIDRADLSRQRDGSGDIVLTLRPSERVSYVVLWPHVRPFRWLRVQPTLRALPDADAAAAALADAFGTDHQTRAATRVADACANTAGVAC